MVRLLVPPGAGLHPAILEKEEPFCANGLTQVVVLSPVIAATLLLGRTVIRRPLLSLPTRSAYFLTRAGLATVIGVPTLAYVSRHERQINESIFRYEGITPPKFQLWQSSHGLTADDYLLIGGIAGLLVSFRMRGLKSISITNRLLGRLGAFSTGTLPGVLACDIPFLGLDADDDTPSIQKTQYEQAVALRRLNDDPKFNATLPHNSRLAERNCHRTVRAEQKALSFASLTEEERAVLRPTMVFSWLDVVNYNNLYKTKNNGPDVEWKFPKDASPAQKIDYILKEVGCVAAMFRPFAHDMRRNLQREPLPHPLQGTHVQEHVLLQHLLVDLINGIPKTVDGEHEKRVDLHAWLSLVDADIGEAHVPVESLQYLHKLKNEFIEHGIPHFTPAIEALVQKFEERALRNK